LRDNAGPKAASLLMICMISPGNSPE